MKAPSERRTTPDVFVSWYTSQLRIRGVVGEVRSVAGAVAHGEAARSNILDRKSTSIRTAIGVDRCAATGSDITVGANAPGSFPKLHRWASAHVCRRKDDPLRRGERSGNKDRTASKTIASSGSGC